MAKVIKSFLVIAYMFFEYSLNKQLVSSKTSFMKTVLLQCKPQQKEQFK